MTLETSSRLGQYEILSPLRVAGIGEVYRAGDYENRLEVAIRPVPMEHRYRREVLDQLAIHGVQPTLVTPPDLVHDFLNDLYRYELRRVRDRLRRHEISKSDYYDRVVEVRCRYPLLSMKVLQWVER